jgi:hypothetical protein
MNGKILRIFDARPWDKQRRTECDRCTRAARER